MEITPITELPDSFAILEKESKFLGFNFLEKMNLEWRSGKNRFNKSGEIALAAFKDGKLIGIGGVNMDPYLNDAGIGRIRHLYVLKEFRRLGVGKALIEKLVEHSRTSFHMIRLRTDTKEAALFYERVGFVPTQNDSATHVFRF
jgi:GNAT superfamily N-acetyltransferase